MFIFSIILAVREFGFGVNAGAFSVALPFSIFTFAGLRRNLSFRSARKTVGSNDIRVTSIGFITAQTAVNRAKLWKK